MLDEDRGGRPDAASALRFLTELIAWVATPWALAAHSVPLAVAAVLVLIGLPTVFATPGDKRQVLVPVPGTVTIGLVVLQLVAAGVSAWLAWPTAVAVAVTGLVLLTVVTELPRWRRLAPLGRDGRPVG
ncbi:hypothetical protein OG799_08220 [Micromonospora sp. NBC_00898]|uniref:hypothetical protein n=1 Tax=Micromonospora sp. NBC_00898 TaxID=2975981 RepID=UPI003866B3AF|nr:hypothetical protein OG799_08220 [Micromonospora sp. NBC_00898]